MYVYIYILWVWVKSGNPPNWMANTKNVPTSAVLCVFDFDPYPYGKPNHEPYPKNKITIR